MTNYIKGDLKMTEYKETLKNNIKELEEKNQTIIKNTYTQLIKQLSEIVEELENDKSYILNIDLKLKSLINWYKLQEQEIETNIKIKKAYKKLMEV